MKRICVFVGLFLLMFSLAFPVFSGEVAKNLNTLVVVVPDDEKLPMRAQAFSLKGNLATLNNPVYSIADGSLGMIQPRTQADPGNVDGYFVPAGPLGTTVVTVTGTNSKGQQVSGTLDVQVIAGPAVSIVIEALAPVPQ